MIRDVDHRGHSWQMVDENESTTWLFDQALPAWEADTFDAIDTYVHGGVFVDVGAWIGMFSLYASPAAEHVYAIEPDPAARSMLERNIVMNGVRNVTVIPWALWGHDDGAVLFSHQGWGSSMTGPTRAGTGMRIRSVSPATLAGIVGPNVDLVKVDVEGSEVEILPGLIGWPCPIHLSIHAGMIDAAALDFAGRSVTRLEGDRENYSVLVRSKGRM